MKIRLFGSTKWTFALIVYLAFMAFLIWDSQSQMKRKEAVRMSVVAAVAAEMDKEVASGSSEYQAYATVRGQAIEKAKVDQQDADVLGKVTFESVEFYRKNHPHLAQGKSDDSKSDNHESKNE